MNATFSEFSFGFAVTDELINWRGTALTAAPYFPTLSEESRLGWDVRLSRPGVPLFIQFKRSSYVSRVYSTSPEYSSGCFSDPFFRMHIWGSKKSNQHGLLCDLNQSGNAVYYVAPLFHQIREFNEFYITRRVCEESVFIPPLSVGRFADDNPHHVSFQDTSVGYRFSEPVKLEQRMNVDDVSKRLTAALEMQTRDAMSVFWNSRGAVLEDMLKEQLKTFGSTKSILQQLETRDNPLDRMALVANLLFGCQLFVVNFRQSLNPDEE